MKEIIFTVIGGVLVTIITSWFGLGNSRVTKIEGVRVRKTGKWIIIFSVIMIFSGLSWAGHESSTDKLYGFTLAGYGVLAFVIGRVVAWFQKI